MITDRASSSASVRHGAGVLAGQPEANGRIGERRLLAYHHSTAVLRRTAATVRPRPAAADGPAHAMSRTESTMP